MHRKLLTGLVSAALISVASAQTAQNNTSAPTGATVTQPNTPAPIVNVAPAQAAAPATTAVTQVVHTPQLPSTADLQKAANEQGFRLERVVQTPTQVIAFYRTPNGQESTVAYQTLPPSGTPAPAPTTVVNTAPTVVYRTAPRVVYYDDYPYYSSYPRYWYPPVSLSFGFGYGRGFYRGGHHWR